MAGTGRPVTGSEPLRDHRCHFDIVWCRLKLYDRARYQDLEKGDNQRKEHIDLCPEIGSSILACVQFASIFRRTILSTRLRILFYSQLFI